MRVAAPMDEFDVTLEPGRKEKHYWAEMWRYRELFYILAARDIAIRYKQTVVGIAWAVIQPLTTMAIMTVLFWKVAGLHSEGRAPYPVMVFAGMLPWMFFSSALSASCQSMVVNANLVSKVYFPRMIIPASSIAAAFVDFLIQFGMLILLMLWYRFLPTWHALALPAFILMGFLAVLGPGLFLTALNVKYRDIRYVIPFIIQIGLYVSPVGFSSSVIREKLGSHLIGIYYLNPMAGVIDGFRWAIFGQEAALYWPGLAISTAVTIAMLFAGIRYFRRTEQVMADII